MKKGSFSSIFRKVASRIVTSTLIALFVLGDFALMPLEAKAALPAGFDTETIVGGLNYPTSMAFTQDGRIFVAEKSGAVRVIKNGVLLTAPLVQLTDINTYADRGLIGIAVDPNFATNKYIYLSYTYENTPGANFTAAKTARIVRLTVNGDTANEGTKLVLVGSVGGTAATPSCENYAMGTDCVASDSSSHSSGGLHFGPDGKLYATLGDGAAFDIADPRALRAQNLDSLNGKLLRINTDGTAPADNPFYNGNPNANRSKVFAYGFRNAFRFSFRPTTGAIYVGDVGWDTWEEINIATAGSNYGWPCREGNNATSYGCTATGYVNPVYTYVHSQTAGGSVTAGVFPNGNVYPASYNNTFFFGDFALNWMKALDMGANDVFAGVTDVMTDTDGANGPVDYAVGPDGYIYFISIYTGELRRFIYTLGNRQPVAQIAATPTSGALPLNVQFSSTGSSDPDGNPLTYLWNFGDNTATSTAANPSHVYTTSGTYTATLSVSDGLGGINIKSITIFAGNQAPVPTITSPESGDLYFPGQVLTVTGSATDPDTGTLPASALTWRAILHHNTHTHVLETHTGTTFQFTAPDHGDPAVYTEMELTATDAGGAIAKTSVNIYLSNGAAPGSNLIQNPSFETADSANPAIPFTWNSYKWGTSTTTFTYPVAGYDGANSRAAKVTVAAYTSGDAKWGFDPVHADPNKDYTFSDRYQSTVPTRIVAASTDINDITTYTELAIMPASASWAQTNVVYHTPADVRTLAIFHLIDQNGTLTVDTFSLTDGTTPPPPPPVVINLIANPSVETAGTGALPENWQKNKWGTSTTTFTYPAAAQDGTKGASITMTARTSGDAKWFFNDVNVTPGTAYTFSNYYQSNVITELVVRYTTAAGAVSYVSLGNVPVSATWAQNTKTITPPAGAAKMTVLHVIKANGNLAVDNYSLTDGTTTPPPQPNLIANGFMETANGANPASWTPTSVGGVTTTFTYPTVGVDGGKAAGIAITNYPSGADGNARWQFNEVPISQGIQYTYEGYYKGSTISDIIGRYTFADGSEHYFGLKKEIPAAANWTFVTATFVGPVNVVSVTLMHEISTVATMEIDNAKLYQSGTGTPNEIIPPVAAFTAPLDGATISGTVTLTSNVTDNSGQAWIFYAVDGTPLGAEMPIPYTQQLNTTTLSNGPHALKVTARDAVGNNSRQIINVIVDNTTTPPPGNNLITNPSLETVNGANPASWTSNKWGTNTTTFTYPVAGQDGANAASINMTARTSGDAKWFFNDIPVTPGTQYTFTNYYKATVQTQLVVRYTNASGVASYTTLATLPVAANWTQGNATFTPPAGTVSATMFHIIYAVGTLTVDNYTLSDGTTTPPPPPGDNLVLNPSLEEGTTSPLSWLQDFWGTNSRLFTYPVAGTDGAKAVKVEITAFTDGDAKWAFEHVAVTPGATYIYSDKYQSNVATSVIVEYKLVNGTYQYQELAMAPVSATWVNYQSPITVPANVETMTVFHLLSSIGFLSVDEVSLSVQ
jgi:glucose/arabinose dehydrogenase